MIDPFEVVKNYMNYDLHRKSDAVHLTEWSTPTIFFAMSAICEAAVIMMRFHNEINLRFVGKLLGLNKHIIPTFPWLTSAQNMLLLAAGLRNSAI